MIKSTSTGILFLGLLLLWETGLAQNSPVDSLLKITKTSVQDTTKASCYLELGDLYSGYNQDSAIICFRKGLDICLSHDIQRKDSPQILKLQGKILKGIVNIFIQKGNYDIALNYIQKALQVYSACKDPEGEALCYKSSGIVYFYQGDAGKSIKSFQSALKIAEERGDKDFASDCINNIGMVHYQEDNNSTALKYFKEALDIRIQLKNKVKIAESYNNLGMIYNESGETSLSLDYYFKALELFTELNNDAALGKIYNNIGVVYKDLDNIEDAEKYFTLSLEKKILTQDKQGEALVLGNLAATALRKGEYRTSILFSDSSLQIAERIGALPIVSTAYGNLSEVYEKSGDLKKALHYYKLYKTVSDSLISVAKFESISEIEAKYENEKKELQIENLTKEKSLQRVELKNKSLQLDRQKTILIFAGSGLLIILIFSVLLYRQSRARKKANFLLAQQNSEIQQKNEEISSQRDEIETQRDVVFQQKEHIENIHRKVTDSINYAKRIQEAVLPDPDTAEKILGEHFILYLPKDIVSGDFYWATKVGNWLVVTVADCTGHGVPGGFMSMLGISYLNEIVRKQEVTQASHVLDHLRKEIISALNQTGSFEEQKDGMDISLCAINTVSLECHWAGANNSLYLIKSAGATERPNKPDELPSNFVEYKGDSMPVAIHSHMKDFTNHVIQLNKGDILYLCSDGYMDQFGGQSGRFSGRKFMSKRFRSLLYEISYLPVSQQKKKLEQTLEDWRSLDNLRFEQTDDITVLGIRV